MKLIDKISEVTMLGPKNRKCPVLLTEIHCLSLPGNARRPRVGELCATICWEKTTDRTARRKRDSERL